jgi:hypothetical protein
VPLAEGERGQEPQAKPTTPGSRYRGRRNGDTARPVITGVARPVAISSMTAAKRMSAGPLEVLESLTTAGFSGS